MTEGTFHILICDNSRIQLEKNIKYVELFNRELHRNVEIHSVLKADIELQNILPYRHMLDMAILALNQEGGDGIQIAKTIQQGNPNIPVIFTANQEINPLEVSSIMPVGLLKNPIDSNRFRVLYHRAHGQMELEKQYEDKMYLELIMKKKRVNLKIRSIISLEKEQKYIIFKTELGMYKIRDTLLAIEKRLPSYFLRISQSVIVNMNDIICIEGNQVFMSSHDDFMIGRTYQKRVDSSYRRYWR